MICLFGDILGARRLKFRRLKKTDLIDEGCNKDNKYKWADGKCYAKKQVPDQGCDKDKKFPLRCGDSSCVASMANCKFVLASCNDGKLPYSCFNGLCTPGREECISSAKKTASTNKCVEKPEQYV